MEVGAKHKTSSLLEVQSPWPSERLSTHAHVDARESLTCCTSARKLELKMTVFSPLHRNSLSSSS